MENQLVKIDCMDWERLRALYLPETPDNILGLATLSNYIRWNKQLGHIDHLAIYSLSGDWSDGTFAVMVIEKISIENHQSDYVNNNNVHSG